MMHSRALAVVLHCLFFGLLLAAAGPAAAQQEPAPSPPVDVPELRLVKAYICEDVVDGVPQIPAIVFSISAGKVSCYTLFDPVGAETYVTHNWYYRDEPSARIRLKLRPPRWATFSTIQLRETDKGPWRVEITDAAGRVLKVLRFSITD